MSFSSSGQIKTLSDQIVSASQTFSDGTLNRTSEEYYRYGSRTFNNFEGTTPQLRIRPVDGSTTRTEITPGYQITGSLLTLNQNVEMTFWGSDQEECLRELSYWVAGYNKILHSNSEQITQPQIYETLTFRWADSENFVDNGDLLIVNTIFKINLYEPSAYRQHVLIPTASLYVTQSTALGNAISGSYEGIRQFTITSSI